MAKRDFEILVLRALLIILLWCEKRGGLWPIGHDKIKNDIRLRISDGPWPENE